LRSAAVHGSIITKADDRNVVRGSEKAISKLLRAVAQRGKNFEFDRLDLIAQI